MEHGSVTFRPLRQQPTDKTDHRTGLTNQTTDGHEVLYRKVTPQQDLKPKDTFAVYCSYIASFRIHLRR